MAFRFIAATTQYLAARTSAGANVAVLTAYPYTIAGWFKVPDVTSDYTIFGIGNSTSTEQIAMIRSGGSSVGDPLRFRITAAGTDRTADSTTAITANRWHHFFAVGASATDRFVLLNAGGRGNSTNNNTPGTVDRTFIGATSGAGVPMSGVIAEVTCWNVALSEAVAKHLYSRKAPPETVYPTNIVGCWTLKDGSLRDIGPRGYRLEIVSGARAATEMDPVNRIRPSRRTYFHVAVAPPPSTQYPIIGGGVGAQFIGA